MRRGLFLIALLIPSLASAQASIDALRPAISARYPSVRWVGVGTLRGWLADERPVVLLDAREPAEFRVSHLRGARRIDPDSTDLSGVHVPRNARVVVYCSVGWRSAIIADRLREAGIRQVYNLEGGIFAWANRGLAVERDGTPVRAVHPYDETWGRMLRAELRNYGREAR